MSKEKETVILPKNKLKIEIIKDTEYLVKGDVKIIASYIAMDLVSRKLAKLV